MSFHSLDYLLFLPLIVLVFFAMPHRLRWLVLLAGSTIFYASWRVDFLALLWFTTLLDYVLARLMPRVEGWRKTALLVLSLCGNLGLLVFFKFAAEAANFWLDYVYRGDAGGYEPLHLLLPLGISFYTFQTLGYSIDVYRGKRVPETHLGYFAAYVMFFPQLIAGPVERPSKLLPQLREKRSFNAALAAAGCGLMLIGYFKKLVIADGLGVVLAPTFSDILRPAGPCPVGSGAWRLGRALPLLC